MDIYVVVTAYNIMAAQVEVSSGNMNKRGKYMAQNGYMLITFLSCAQPVQL